MRHHKRPPKASGVQEGLMALALVGRVFDDVIVAKLHENLGVFKKSLIQDDVCVVFYFLGGLIFFVF